MTLSPTSWPGGAATVQTCESFFGNAVTIANGASGDLTWDGSNGPDTLLNRAAPALPTVIDAGVYIVAVFVTPTTALTANGRFAATLELDLANDAVPLKATGGTGGTAYGPQAALTLAYRLPAGGQIRVRVSNLDGVASRDFTLTGATIQRVS